jgi:hypothetical protein
MARAGLAPPTSEPLSCIGLVRFVAFCRRAALIPASRRMRRAHTNQLRYEARAIIIPGARGNAGRAISDAGRSRARAERGPIINCAARYPGEISASRSGVISPAMIISPGRRACSRGFSPGYGTQLNQATRRRNPGYATRSCCDRSQCDPRLVLAAQTQPPDPSSWAHPPGAVRLLEGLREILRTECL